MRQSAEGMPGAEAAFQHVLQLNPNEARAYLQLTLLLEWRGDKTQATALLEKTVQLAPGLTEAHP